LFCLVNGQGSEVVISRKAVLKSAEGLHGSEEEDAREGIPLAAHCLDSDKNATSPIDLPLGKSHQCVMLYGLDQDFRNFKST
jgi:hypothetical protein